MLKLSTAKSRLLFSHKSSIIDVWQVLNTPLVWNLIFFVAQENKSQLLTFGALEHLIKLLNHENKMVKRNAIMCVGTMASESK